MDKENQRNGDLLSVNGNLETTTKRVGKTELSGLGNNDDEKMCRRLLSFNLIL
jgi:hypothetical protein